MNVAAFTGNLGRDPEVKVVGQTSVAKFTVAVSRNFKRHGSDEWEQETAWVPCEAWDTAAERIGRTFIKGDLVEIEGSLKTDSWEDKETKKQRSRMFIRVTKFKNLTKRDRTNNSEDTSPAKDTPEATSDNDGEVTEF